MFSRAATTAILGSAVLIALPAQAVGFIAALEASDPSRDIALQSVALDREEISKAGEDQGGFSALSLAQQLASYAVRMVQDVPDIRQQIGAKSDFSAHKA